MESFVCISFFRVSISVVCSGMAACARLLGECVRRESMDECSMGSEGLYVDDTVSPARGTTVDNCGKTFEFVKKSLMSSPMVALVRKRKLYQIPYNDMFESSFRKKEK